jgi:hypothetical protein
MCNSRWTKEQINEWYKKQTWLVGCNFIPSTAINQLEMWQKDTFDIDTIRRELRMAKDIGFNTVRVFLHDLLWQFDDEGFKDRIKHYLDITVKNKIKTMFVLLDDCWNSNPKIGKQPNPIPGVHNSGWLQSPGIEIVTAPAGWSRLEDYVYDTISTFAKDERILIWDLYNEPGNNKLAEKSLPLLKTVFKSARKAKPGQPLTAGIWFDNRQLNDFQLTESDIITFHSYREENNLKEQIKNLKEHKRPLICTEYMARQNGSRFETHLPIFKRESVGCYNWGLVSGKTQTIYPWNSTKGTPIPKEWFHDIFNKDGTPFSIEEVGSIKNITSSN